MGIPTGTASTNTYTAHTMLEYDDEVVYLGTTPRRLRQRTTAHAHPTSPANSGRQIDIICDRLGIFLAVPLHWPQPSMLPLFLQEGYSRIFWCISRGMGVGIHVTKRKDLFVSRLDVGCRTNGFCPQTVTLFIREQILCL